MSNKIYINDKKLCLRFSHDTLKERPLNLVKQRENYIGRVYLSGTFDNASRGLQLTLYVVTVERTHTVLWTFLQV